MKNFALVGSAGYIAPRHMSAIKDVGGHLIASYDPKDSVGIIDSYFPNSYFFTEFERFDRFIDKCQRKSNFIDIISICSPNYLHDSHIRFALRSGTDVICEKPLVLNPWNIEPLIQYEKDFGKKVNTILQLRLHPSIIELKKKIDDYENSQIYDVDLTYITSRGNWYLQSWKGDEKKSGGIATNIGIHFFDMLHHLFGSLKQNIVTHRDITKASGYLEYQKARVRWYLSIDHSDIPIHIRETGVRTYRSIKLNGKDFEFSSGFSDLHKKSYLEILKNKGFGLEDNRAAIETVSEIRTSEIRSISDYHPFLKK